MIDITNLTKEKIPGNYFAYDAYIEGDFEMGMIENRSGNRLIALPETLIQGIYNAMEQELGQASGLVLFNCGRWWGKNFYTRFVEEVSEYYEKPLADMSMIELMQCLKQCWKTHGWGTMDLDINYYQKGFLVVNIDNSPFAENAPQNLGHMCFVEAGILSSFFSQISGRELHCLQTACESMGEESNRFIVGLKERLQPVEKWVEERKPHNNIMENLCN
jgi:uncharacterized protein